MSEPQSAIARVTIDRQDLLRYLDASPLQTGAWDDWTDTFEPIDVAGIDATLAMGSYRYQIRRVLSKSMSTGRFCRYTESDRTFTFGTFFYSSDVADYAYFFAIARGLTPYLRTGQGGFAVVAETLWGDATFAVMDLVQNRSRFLETRDGLYKLRRKDATRELAALKSVYAVENPVPIDHLDHVR